ncbi:MAG: HepT-like ribonuclease domain-containing protein [Bacteroidales bacterium]
MNEKVLKCLYDIQLAISEIDSFIEMIPNEFEEYSRHPVIKRAIERNLEIIGEAVNRILKEEPEYPIEKAYRIVGLRNQIIHGYDTVSDENIWAMLNNHLPKLRTEVSNLIKNEEG